MAADNGFVMANGKPVKSSYKVKPLDRIQIVMPYPRRDTEIKPEDIPLRDTLRGRRPADRKQAGRHGRTPRRG